MSEVVGVGAVVTVNHWQRRMSAEQAARLDDTVANFCALLFAKLDTGDLIVAPEAAIGLGIPRRDLNTEVFFDFVPRHAAQAPTSPAHDTAYLDRWAPILSHLARMGIECTAEQLIGLPFETLPDGEVRGLLG